MITSLAALLSGSTEQPTATLERSAEAWPAVALEREILAVMDGEVAGETVDATFRRREHELRALFDRLTVIESWQLHRRLTVPRPDDPIATRFARMIVERRMRLLSFLADARRRAVQKGAR